MPQTIPFSNVDAAWLQMEDPTNLMMITGILLLDRPVDFARLRQTLEYRLLPLSRFQMRVAKSRIPFQLPKWERDPHFSLDYHLQRIALPAPGNQATLQELIGNFMSTGLDFSRPLWQFHLVENVGNGCALLGRIHHTIGDGTALVAVMLSMMDFHPDMPLKPPPDKAKEEKPWNPLATLLNPTLSAWKNSQKMVNSVWSESVEAMLNPDHALELTGKAVKGAATLGRLLLMPPDPPTMFKGDLGVQKRAAWSATVPLRDVKAIGKVMDAKVNDVLLTAMTGGLRRYMIRRGDPVDSVTFRAAVPVNLRPMERALELGNEFALVFLPLPVGIEDPHDRLLTLKKRMDAIKDSPEAVITFGILNLLGMSPQQIADQIVALFGSKATAVMTNVPGPRMTLYLAGAAVDNMMFWVPQSGRLGLGVSIMSYDGKVTLGVATDAGLIPDPDAIITGFHEEFAALMEMVQQAEAAPAAPVDDNLAQTMAALSELEERLAQQEAAVRMEIAPITRCQGMTKAGQPCRNRPLTGSDYCRLHQPKNAAITDGEA
ncbi:MAG: wax ester/triacylglycerol synthase family O-acyltransferase [Anaerolineales bacterium]|nr:wax ester/triacylglycerol synthase family O-acyltransferase [Anaerolineales bacterium]MCB8953286.1 wax ester/triacylglycerol synthase family O-acyltransferase [Ardenticatenales bacterium]